MSSCLASPWLDVGSRVRTGDKQWQTGTLQAPRHTSRRHRTWHRDVTVADRDGSGGQPWVAQPVAPLCPSTCTSSSGPAAFEHQAQHRECTHVESSGHSIKPLVEFTRHWQFIFLSRLLHLKTHFSQTPEEPLTFNSQPGLLHAYSSRISKLPPKCFCNAFLELSKQCRAFLLETCLPINHKKPSNPLVIHTRPQHQQRASSIWKQSSAPRHN